MVLAQARDLERDGGAAHQHDLVVPLDLITPGWVRGSAVHTPRMTPTPGRAQTTASGAPARHQPLLALATELGRLRPETLADDVKRHSHIVLTDLPGINPARWIQTIISTINIPNGLPREHERLDEPECHRGPVRTPIINWFIGLLAEGVGFEPTVRFHAHTLSKRAP